MTNSNFVKEREYLERMIAAVFGETVEVELTEDHEIIDNKDDWAFLIDKSYIFYLQEGKTPVWTAEAIIADPGSRHEPPSEDYKVLLVEPNFYKAVSMLVKEMVDNIITSIEISIATFHDFEDEMEMEDEIWEATRNE